MTAAVESHRVGDYTIRFDARLDASRFVVVEHASIWRLLARALTLWLGFRGDRSTCGLVEHVGSSSGPIAEHVVCGVRILVDTGQAPLSPSVERSFALRWLAMQQRLRNDFQQRRAS
jgi:hypothetical protein